MRDSVVPESKMAQLRPLDSHVPNVDSVPNTLVSPVDALVYVIPHACVDQYVSERIGTH